MHKQEEINPAYVYESSIGLVEFKSDGDGEEEPMSCSRCILKGDTEVCSNMPCVPNMNEHGLWGYFVKIEDVEYAK